MALGGRGRYGAAFALLDPLVRDPVVPDAIRAHAAVTRASHLRQLGSHRWARRWDGLGLSLAARAAPDPSGPDPIGPDPIGRDVAAARADALLGLAADALGLVELELSERLLTAAEPVVAAHPSWRPGVRLSWIRAELALARDEPGTARKHAERGLAVARAAGAVRHQVKSELVALVARSCVGDPVYGVLEMLSQRASAAGLYSLEWPIALLLTRLPGPGGTARHARHRARYHELLTEIRLGCDPQGRLVLDRSPWVSIGSGA